MPDIMELAMEGKYSCEEASREVVADAMADILPDSHFVENLYQKNQNLFERVLNKLKEFVKNVREYFAHVNPNTKLEAAVLKENTESGMRYLEKVVEAFDKTAEAAVENYQQGTTESTAESKTQYKTRGKYWRPDLKGSEWRLLERRMAEEIGSRENFLDEATKWVYANEKGVQVFALYGVGDGTDATPLYAVGGKRAKQIADDLLVKEDAYEKNDRGRGAVDSWIESIRRKKGSSDGNRSTDGNGRTAVQNDELHGGSQRSNAGGAAERGSEDQRGVKEKFSLRDSTGRELTEAQQAYFKDSKVRDAEGNLLVMYHQTDGTFTVFDTKHKGAGAGDDETPFGIFLKRTPRNIGVRGEKQMELYADIRNPLRVRDRTELVSKLRELSVDYARLKDESAQIDKEYGAKFEEAKNAFKSFLIQWRKNNPDAPPRAAYDADGFDAAFNAEDNVVKEWTRAKDELALRAKTSITQALRDNGYDGVILENDKGSWGRSTDAYIALDANQVKNTTNKTPTADPDIRYSLRENFPNEIDSWAEDGMPEGVRFTLGSTGPVLQGLGAIESDIYMEGDKIQKILQDHPEMTLAEIKKVPQILEDPALILKSEGRGKSGANSRLVCFGLTKAQNGQPVMTVMDLRPRENGFVVDDMQKVNSAYTKKNPMAFIQKSDVVYADKKRAIPLLRTTGLTISSQQLLRNGYIGSISYKGGSVNIQGVPFSSVVKTAENTGNDRNALRDVAMSDRDVLRRAADLALSDRKMNFTQADRERLKIFKKRLDILDEKQTQRQGYLQAKRDILSNSARLF